MSTVKSLVPYVLAYQFNKTNIFYINPTWFHDKVVKESVISKWKKIVRKKLI